MADLKFTRQEIDELIEKLGSFAADLSGSEWRLLLAIFAAAVDRVEPSTDNKSGTLPAPEVSGNLQKVEDPSASNAAELRDQLRQSYVPGRLPPPPRPIVIRVTP
jgi:hypothetical protein